MRAFRRLFPALPLSCLLFVTALPVLYRPLEWWMRPTSVIHWPEYTPMLITLPDLYDRPHVWDVSLALGVLAVLTLAVTMRHLHFSLLGTVVATAIPLALVAAFHYAVLIRLDDYLYCLVTAGVAVFPLREFFDGAMFLAFVRALLIYLGSACALLIAAWVVAGRAGEALTRRCS